MYSMNMRNGNENFVGIRLQLKSWYYGSYWRSVCRTWADADVSVAYLFITQLNKDRGSTTSLTCYSEAQT